MFSNDNTVKTASDQATGAAKLVTSTLGNSVGGVSRTAGNITGAATKGVGDTVSSTMGEAGKPLGDALGSLGTGLQYCISSAAKSVEKAGQWKSG